MHIDSEVLNGLRDFDGMMMEVQQPPSFYIQCSQDLTICQLSPGYLKQFRIQEYYHSLL